MASERRTQRGLSAALEALRKHMGEKPLFTPPVRGYVPMRHEALARLLSGEKHPGIPTGTFIEVLGNEFAGKTTLTFALMEAVINQPKRAHLIRTDDGIETIDAPRRVLFLDFEYSLDVEYLLKSVKGAKLAQVSASGKLVNADEANVFVHQPETLEEGGDVLLAMINSGEFGLGIIDSIPAMLAMEEQAKTMAQNTMGVQARAMGKLLRKSVGPIARFGVPMVFVNQWRDKIGVVFGDPRTSPGGKALRYFNSIKLDVSGSRDNPWFEDGKVVKIKTMKNKVTGLKDKSVVYYAGNSWGLSAEVELSERALACGVLDMKSHGRPVRLMRGREVVRSYDNAAHWLRSLRENDKLFAAVKQQCDKRGVVTQIAGKSGKGPWGDE